MEIHQPLHQNYLMKSLKPIKPLQDLLTKKTFFFPNSLANDRVQNTHEHCILMFVNGKRHVILTGKNVELDEQEFAILKDSGIILPNYTYAINEEFDPMNRPYEI